MRKNLVQPKQAKIRESRDMMQDIHTTGVKPMPWDNLFDNLPYKKTETTIETHRYIEIDADGNKIPDF